MLAAQNLCLLDRHLGLRMPHAYHSGRGVRHEKALPKTEHGLAVKFAGGLREFCLCEKMVSEIPRNKLQTFRAQFRTKFHMARFGFWSILQVKLRIQISRPNFASKFASKFHIEKLLGAVVQSSTPRPAAKCGETVEIL